MRRYVTFCNEKNIARVFEPDRGDITKCARRVPRTIPAVTCFCRYLMGVENFQQIKQVTVLLFYSACRIVTPPLSSLAATLSKKARPFPLPSLSARHDLTHVQPSCDALALPIHRSKKCQWTRAPPRPERSVAPRRRSNCFVTRAAFASSFLTPVPQVWNGLLQKLWEQSSNPKKYGEPTDVDVDLKVKVLSFPARLARSTTRTRLTFALQECEPLFAASKTVAQNVCQNEKCTPDRSTWGCAPGCNFQSTVVKWFRAAKEESERLERDPKRSRMDAASAGAAHKRAAVSKEPPIILLPRIDSAAINMRNGQDFFEKGIYVSHQEDLSKAPPVQFNVTCDFPHSLPSRPLPRPSPLPVRRLLHKCTKVPLTPQVQRRRVHLQGHDGVHHDGVARARGGRCCHGQHMAGASQRIADAVAHEALTLRPAVQRVSLSGAHGCFRRCQGILRALHRRHTRRLRQAVERAAHRPLPQEQALRPCCSEASTSELPSQSVADFVCRRLHNSRPGQIWEGVIEQARRKQLL
jgi:hypothetical protein